MRGHREEIPSLVALPHTSPTRQQGFLGTRPSLARRACVPLPSTSDQFDSALFVWHSGTQFGRPLPVLAVGPGRYRCILPPNTPLSTNSQ